MLLRVTALRQLAERAATILRLIDAQGRLTSELAQQIEQADSMKRLEDLYLPYKPKKQTRASAARDRGLEPLADAIWTASPEVTNLAEAAAAYLNPEKDLPSTDEVLQGAADILAERISEHAEVRVQPLRRIERSIEELDGKRHQHAVLDLVVLPEIGVGVVRVTEESP